MELYLPYQASQALEIGSTVAFVKEFSCYPHAIIEVGERGTVVELELPAGDEEKQLGIFLHRLHDGLVGEWNNILYINSGMYRDNTEFFQAIRDTLVIVPNDEQMDKRFTTSMELIKRRNAVDGALHFCLNGGRNVESMEDLRKILEDAHGRKTDRHALAQLLDDVLVAGGYE